MNGADRLCDVLLVNGVNVCFANPGTSEMHFVAALDRKPAMRCVLGLFEGVVTGAADGYGRMTGRPAATLLHTGPGLANGLANLHNARRARSPVLNVVGDHASYHLKYNAPLTSDIESLARPMSDWVGRAAGSDDVGASAEAAYVAARSLSGVATLILPADAAWGEVTTPMPAAVAVPVPKKVSTARIDEIAKAMRGKRVGLIVGGDSTHGAGLELAARVAAGCNGTVLCPAIPPRVARGRGRPNVLRIPYPVDQATAALREYDVIVLCSTPEPVAFFAYPGKPSRLFRDDTEVLTLAERGDDQISALEALADALGAPKATSRPVAPAIDAVPSGPLTADGIAIVLARNIPENAILVNESLSSGSRLYELATDAAPHDVLTTTGGAIGFGIPAAIGAAIACPDRKVINFQSDGCGMYTVQGLWTQARENLDVVTLISANRSYGILKTEMANLGFNEIGHNASRMISLDDPALDWVKLAEGMGVQAARADTAERLETLLRAACSRRGPFLIECVI